MVFRKRKYWCMYCLKHFSKLEDKRKHLEFGGCVSNPIFLGNEVKAIKKRGWRW